MTFPVLPVPTLLSADIPIDPSCPDARQWLIDELGKPIYQAAKPNLFDVISKAVGDWFASLFAQDTSGVGAIVPVIVVLIVIALIVAGIVVFGRPRLNRKGTPTTVLFGVDDARTADQLRSSAASAADRGDFTLAVEEAFRGLARGLAERTIVATAPGTTAQDFAGRAAQSFPEHGVALHSCANLFDAVRYLDETGTASAYHTVRDADLALQRASPSALEAIQAVSV